MSQLTVRYHHVSVSIKDQIAETRVEQVFYNPNDWQVEGDYIFPVPLGASISNFVLWIDGKPVEGEVLNADEARQTYEEIVSTLKDPALLEYSDQEAVRARIFPIPPRGERRIELQYSQVLTAEAGLVHYVYPLGTEKFSLEPIDSVSVTVDIESPQPIRAVYSPSHTISISRESDASVRAGYEEQDVLPDQDFSLIYSIGESEAFHLLSYRDSTDLTDPDGFFLLLMAPSLQEATRSIPKDILLVVDQSGSMEGEKFEQVRQALRYILDHLNTGDRFNIIAFSTAVDIYSPEYISAAESAGAVSWVNRLRAEGSTDINRALLEAAALVEGDRPTYLIFLTDGLPTVGEVESEKIIANMQSLSSQNLSLFPFGVGYDVDTYLLDSLAQNHHGRSMYVLPGEALDEYLSDFYSKIRAPVLTNLELDFGELQTRDIYPDPLPDLFLGSQVAVVGRYEQGGEVNVKLRGVIDGISRELTYPDQIFTEGSTAEREVEFSKIPSIWATRKIGYLLQQIRLHGPEREVIDEIVALSIRYGIVTPYTSYLVTEPAMLGGQEQERIVAEELQKFNDLAGKPTFGREAVEQAEGQNSLANAETAPSAPIEIRKQVRMVGSNTFVNDDGIWTDTRFHPEEMKPIQVEFLSDQYFSLTRKHPQLARAFALGPRVIAIFGEEAYQVTINVSAGAAVPTPTTNQNSGEPTPAAQSVGKMDEQDAKPEPASLLPCWSGLFAALLPISAMAILYITPKWKSYR
jgi:Ca-activated chloride channel family protein